VSHTPEPAYTALLAERDALKAEKPELMKLFEDVAAAGRRHAQADRLAQPDARR